MNDVETLVVVTTLTMVVVLVLGVTVTDEGQMAIELTSVMVEYWVMVTLLVVVTVSVTVEMKVLGGIEDMGDGDGEGQISDVVMNWSVEVNIGSIVEESSIGTGMIVMTSDDTVAFIRIA
jgi:hypothetical protein